MFAEKFRDTPVSTRQAIYNLNQRFQRHGSVHDLPTSGRTRTSPRTIWPQLPKLWFKVQKKFIRKTSAEFIIPPTRVCRIVKALKNWKRTALIFTNASRWWFWSEGRILRMVFDSLWGSSRLPSTHSVNREASFKFTGRINRHNNVYWSDCNAHEVIQEELSVPGLTVGKAFGVAELWVLFWWYYNWSIIPWTVTWSCFTWVREQPIVRQHWNHLAVRRRSTALQFTSTRIP
jgi:hypothetical protein